MIEREVLEVKEEIVVGVCDLWNGRNSDSERKKKKKKKERQIKYSYRLGVYGVGGEQIYYFNYFSDFK